MDCVCIWGAECNCNGTQVVDCEGGRGSLVVNTHRRGCFYVCKNLGNIFCLIARNPGCHIYSSDSGRMTVIFNA